jgi:hypothetical protein
MGYCKLPARHDYWKKKQQNSCLPSHWMDGTISRDKFEYLWRNISLSNDGDDDEDIDNSISDEADGEFVDDHDYAAHNNDSSDDDDSSDEEEEEEEEEDDDNNNNNNADGSFDYDTVVDDDDDDDESWYKKASFMIDWTNKFSRMYCVHPGFAISIDEMMKLFKGRSNMTHIMKCKPIPKGYKFYAMCCAQSGYCFFFFPDGLKDKKKRMIHEGVVWCVRHLPDRKKKQYVVVMDNYFTMTKTMIGTRKCGVAAMGTARGRPGWPPKEIGKKSIQDKRYNSLYYMNDKVGNYRIFRWIDNNIVKMVSNIHTGGSTDEQVLKNRRKPRLNEFNKQHVRLIWGDQHRKQLKIPQIINDYNHWMLGVDVVDQLIAYYRPKIRCRRTWVPIFLHCLDILRVNSYVLYKETSYNHPDVNNDTIRDHKHFLIAFVNSLIRRGNAETKKTKKMIIILNTILIKGSEN